MSLLFEEMNKLMEKNPEELGEINDYIPVYRTGIDIFDYANGFYRSNGEIAAGIAGGRIMTDIGRSGSGKSSVLIKQACKIVEDYDEGMIFHLDFERSSTKERILTLSGWTEETFEKKYKHITKSIYVETIYNLVKSIRDLKVNNYDNLKVDSGDVDINGDPIYVLPPTIIIVDSIALMAPKDVEDGDDLKGQMGASSIAKANTNVFKRIISPLEDGNILLFAVNHINTKIDINPIAKDKADINYLKQNETLPGKLN